MCVRVRVWRTIGGELDEVGSLLKAVDDVALPVGGEDAKAVQPVGVVRRQHLEVRCRRVVRRLLAVHCRAVLEKGLVRLPCVVCRGERPGR